MFTVVLVLHIKYVKIQGNQNNFPLLFVTFAEQFHSDGKWVLLTHSIFTIKFFTKDTIFIIISIKKYIGMKIWTD